MGGMGVGVMEDMEVLGLNGSVSYASYGRNGGKGIRSYGREYDK